MMTDTIRTKDLQSIVDELNNDINKQIGELIQTIQAYDEFDYLEKDRKELLKILIKNKKL
jgi:hypothetical protein